MADVTVTLTLKEITDWKVDPSMTNVTRADVLASHEALRAERDEVRARVAELEAEVERLREREENARQDAMEADR